MSTRVLAGLHLDQVLSSSNRPTAVSFDEHADGLPAVRVQTSARRVLSRRSPSHDHVEEPPSNLPSHTLLVERNFPLLVLHTVGLSSPCPTSPNRRVRGKCFSPGPTAPAEVLIPARPPAQPAPPASLPQRTVPISAVTSGVLTPARPRARDSQPVATPDLLVPHFRALPCSSILHDPASPPCTRRPVSRT